MKRDLTFGLIIFIILWFTIEWSKIEVIVARSEPIQLSSYGDKESKRIPAVLFDGQLGTSPDLPICLHVVGPGCCSVKEIEKPPDEHGDIWVEATVHCGGKFRHLDNKHKKEK